METFQTNPPNDTLVLFDIRTLGESVLAEYRWSKSSDVPAGNIELMAKEAKIQRLVITFSND